MCASVCVWVSVIFLYILLYSWHDNDLLLGQHMKLQCYKTKTVCFSKAVALDRSAFAIDHQKYYIF
jgi:hypothetical protein